MRAPCGHGAGVLGGSERFVHLPTIHPEALSDARGNLYEEIADTIEVHAQTGVTPPIPDYPGLKGRCRRGIHPGGDPIE